MQPYFDKYKIKQLLNNSQNILVTSHKNPDGDAVGSVMATYHFLKNMHKNVQVVLPDSFSPVFNWMPAADEIIFYDKNKKRADELISKTDLIFCQDYNALNRTGHMQTALQDAKAKRILIDHHPYPEVQEFDALFSDVNYSSTCQMIYTLIQELGLDEYINHIVATCLYTGIMTDTGSFKFSTTTAQTHRVVASLIEKGADNAAIHIAVFDNNTEDRLRLTGFALSQKLTVDYKHGVAWFILSQQDLKKFYFQKGDTEGLVNYGLSIKGIEVAVLFTETDERIKISFRSKGKIVVIRLLPQLSKQKQL
jgi:phosphoesterase RecJ-like protein